MEIGEVLTGPHRTIWSLLRTTRIPKSSIHKWHLVYSFNEDGSNWGTNFCDIISNTIAKTRNWFYNICFTNEFNLYFNGRVNKNNIRYWLDENPHCVRESHTKYPENLNVWTWILGNHIVDRFFRGNFDWRRLFEFFGTTH